MRAPPAPSRVRFADSNDASTKASPGGEDASTSGADHCQLQMALQLLARDCPPTMCHAIVIHVPRPQSQVRVRKTFPAQLTREHGQGARGARGTQHTWSRYTVIKIESLPGTKSYWLTAETSCLGSPDGCSRRRWQLAKWPPKLMTPSY